MGPRLREHVPAARAAMTRDHATYTAILTIGVEREEGEGEERARAIDANAR